MYAGVLTLKRSLDDARLLANMAWSAAGLDCHCTSGSNRAFSVLDSTPLRPHPLCLSHAPISPLSQRIDPSSRPKRRNIIQRPARPRAPPLAGCTPYLMVLILPSKCSRLNVTIFSVVHPPSVLNLQEAVDQRA